MYKFLVKDSFVIKREFEFKEELFLIDFVLVLKERFFKDSKLGDDIEKKIILDVEDVKFDIKMEE